MPSSHGSAPDLIFRFKPRQSSLRHAIFPACSIELSFSACFVCCPCGAQRISHRSVAKRRHAPQSTLLYIAVNTCIRVPLNMSRGLEDGAEAGRARKDPASGVRFRDPVARCAPGGRALARLGARPVSLSERWSMGCTMTHGHIPPNRHLMSSLTGTL